MGEPNDYDYYENDDCCPNCGGEGYVFNCQDEIGCVDPEGGCDLCMRRCGWCNPRPKKSAPSDLQQVLADALAKARGKP